MDLQLMENNSESTPQLTDLDAQPTVPQGQQYFDSFAQQQFAGNQQQQSTQKVHQWYMQNGSNAFQQDSGIQSMENSKAPSIVSVNMIGRTQQASIDATDSEQFVSPAPPQLSNTAPQQLPVETQNAKKVLPELIPLLRDSDAEVACRALEMVIHIAKLDAAQPYYDPIIDDPQLINALTLEISASSENKRILRLTLCALFHISNQPQGMKLILDTCSATDSDTSPQPRSHRFRDGLSRLVASLVECVAIGSESCYKYSLLILHNILCGKGGVAKKVVEFVRDERALGIIVEWLAAEKNEKLLSIIVDIVQIVCDRNSEQKAFFIALNGPTMVCSLMRWAQYENLLWRATRLLKSVSNYDPQKIVDSGAYDVLPLNMDHASQRLVVELLQCTRDLSDMSTNKLDISHLLSRLVQLLGTNDMVVRQLCIQSLANLSANNRRSKELLCQMDILSTLKHVLYETESMLDERNMAPPKFAEILEDIQENTLTAIRNLFSGHSFELEIQQQVLQQNGAEFFLRKLQQMRPALVRKSLMILSKIAQHDSSIPFFRHSCLQVGPDVETNFAERLVYLLYVSGCKLKQTKAIESVNLNELMHLAMLTMQKLCRDGVLLRQISFYLKEYQIALNVSTPSVSPQLTFLPIFALTTKDDLLIHSAIGLLNDMLEVPEISSALTANGQALAVLEKWREFQNPTGLLAQKMLKYLSSQLQPIHSSSTPNHSFYPAPASNHHHHPGTPIHRNTRENSPCPLFHQQHHQLADPMVDCYPPYSSSSSTPHPMTNPRSFPNMPHPPNDSGYFGLSSSSLLHQQQNDSTNQMLYSGMVSPTDEYYSHMAERYQSMQISGIGDDSINPHSNIAHQQRSHSSFNNQQMMMLNDEADEFYCDDSRTEFYM